MENEVLESASIKLTREQLLLVEENMDLAYNLAARWYRTHNNPCQFADIAQMALLGLCEAAVKFQPERGSKFSTYAYSGIILAIRTSIYDYAEWPRTAWTWSRAHACDLPRLLRGKGTTIDVQPRGYDEEAWKERNANIEILRAQLDALLNILDDKSRIVIESVWFQGLSFKEISRRFPISRHSASNLFNKAMRLLRYYAPANFPVELLQEL